MRALTEKKDMAIVLRKRGVTQPDIVKLLRVSKGIISMWLKDVPVPIWYSDMIKNKRKARLLIVVNSEGWKEKNRQNGINNRTRIPHTVGKMEYLECNSCKQSVKINKFSKRGESKWSSWCNDCASMYQKNTKNNIIDILGGRCECGCTDKSLLDIHHKKYDGKYERLEKSRYTILKEIRDMPHEIRMSNYKLCCPICHNVEYFQRKHPNMVYTVKCIMIQ
jgi:predicted transcriptional regulator